MTPRFVILEHDHPFLHWDLMLEKGDVLRTWRLPALPAPGRKIAATYLAEHRRLYLDYEGPVSPGRGRVVRWDGGTYSVLVDQSDRITITLDGSRVKGQVDLVQQDGRQWIFQWMAEQTGS